MLIIERIKDVRLPSYGTEGSAGLDFYVPLDILNYCDATNTAIINDKQVVRVPPQFSVNIGSGIKAKIPSGQVLVAFNKSGVALKKKFQVGACVIDSDYRGEIHLHLFNVGNKVAYIEPGEKLVQFVLLPYFKTDVMEGIVHNNTMRGEGGFGSTNK